MTSFKKLLVFVGVLYSLSALTIAQASAGENWTYKGWSQSHPHKGGSELAQFGTQHYFVPADVLKSQIKEMDLQPVAKVDDVAEPMVAEPAVAEPVVAAQPEHNPDLDGDGVLNEQDQCSNTPEGERVNKQGCWVLAKIFFAFDKADVQSRYNEDLDKVVLYLKEHPELKVELGGHTDSSGDESYNVDLSNRRAMAIKNYLLDRGISKERMHSVGYGLSRPEADNSTLTGRFFNRRAEVHPFKAVE
ncbi:MAG: OmpA family protein [Magnetococcales bacterium]|nr:OmpA family protein [Magnetococcales bacterium]